MSTTSKRLVAVAVSAALFAPAAALATNGMNLEGYGPIATGMGGASMAYDNGTAAMMNNPATISLGDEGNRLDVALGNLGPDVEASAMGMDWPSDSTSFMMPAVGWTKNNGDLAYGAGAFAQGGMGTEYAPTSTQAAPGPGFFFVPPATHPMGGSAQGNALATGSTIAGTVMGWQERSEVGVMRLLVPVSYKMNNALTLGGSLDYVQANMDLQMAMTGAMMNNMMTPGQQTIGTISGSMITAMQGMMGGAAGQIGDLYGGYFDFSDDSDYSGQASGSGFAAKIGFTYAINNKLKVGGTYHSKTSISDLEGDADVSMAVLINGSGDAVIPLSGTIAVKNFQWPSTIGLGVSYQATPELMIVADVKKINWSEVMENFEMSFTASGNTGMAANFNGTTMDATMYQNWEDQTVMQLGVAYGVTKELTLRAGYNAASNPIPDDTLHYLFPATVETHMTLGAGYAFSQASEVNFSYTMAPESSATNGMGMDITHAQTNWQLMYSHKF